MGVEFICSQYMIAVDPLPRVITKSTAYNERIPVFDERLGQELAEYLCSYEEKIYVFESGDFLWAVVPSTFPSSRLAFAFRFEMDTDEALRIIDGSEYREYFKLSSGIPVGRARMTKAMAEKTVEFNCFFDRLKSCLLLPTDIHLIVDAELLVEKLKNICADVSELVGCPVTFGKDSVYGEIITAGEFDASVFKAFLLAAMMLAKESAVDRSMRISFELLSQNIAAVVELDGVDDDCSGVLSFLSEMSAERVMPFGFIDIDSTLKIGIQPYRREVSYLGLKQNIEWDFL